VSLLLVTTAGEGSMDRCGRELARRLPVPSLEVDLDGTSAGWFGVPWTSRATVLGLAGDRRLLAQLRARPEVPHFAHHHFARYGPRLGRPYVVTAHDLIRLGDLTGDRVLISRPTRHDAHYIRRDVAGIRAAPAVIAVSETTRRELVGTLGLDPTRVTVVHHGLDHDLFRPLERRLVDGPYVLFVGSEHPRKNFVGLLRAFALLHRDRPELTLVKVGAPGSSEAPFGAAATRAIAELGLDDAVRMAGEVPDEDLPAYYTHAECLVLPSYAEGFGLPPLEAMACGCPVVVSTAGALPEIVGDAGPAVPPGDDAGLAAAIAAVLDDVGLRHRMRDAGLRRAAGFSWERAAAETLRVYETVDARPAFTRR
jgi:glycosyltransferase involved in cell wall biosynthesis